jgi:ABC-type nitrate/sulfonate/bicarbonate transport system permease component
MLAGSQGIGYYLLSMQYALKAPEMYSAIILLTLVAYVLNRVFVMWESRVIRWARSREAHNTL